MTNKIVLCLTVLLLSANQVSAKTRNCTKLEKKEANSMLFALEQEGDTRNRLIQRHLPFGVHQSLGNATNEELLIQGGYSMMHDRDLNTSLWVSYRLTAKDRESAQGKSRVNCFRKDPRLEGASATTTDYNEPTFDQGHLANDADLKDNLIEQLNSYVMSNMSPQYCRFNRGIWLTLENVTRSWAKKYGTILVTSGEIFDRDNDNERDSDKSAIKMKSRNGKSRVSVPSHFYKVFLRRKPNSNKYYSIAFILPHNNNDNGASWTEVRPHIMPMISSIKDVENKADIDLMPKLDTAYIIESESGENWDFNKVRSNMNKTCK